MKPLRGLGWLLLATGSAEAARRLLTPRAEPPAPAPVRLEQYFSPEEIRRGSSFARPQRTLALLRGTIDLALIARLAYRPPRWLRLSERALPGAMLAGVALADGLALPTLPLSAISRRRAMAFGLDTQSWGGWLEDLGKAMAIQSVMAGGAAGATIALTRRYPRGWWAPAAGGTVAFGALLAAVAPVILDPLFNDFTPLPEGQVRSDVLELAREAEVKVGEVYSVDASRRTTAANAYVSGLGPTKRVVLFDTLLDRYSRDEIRLVVAHELGHVRHRDVPRNVAFAALVSPGLALAAQRLSWLVHPARGTTETLPALILAAALASAPVGLVGNRLSRALERRADDFSLRLAGAPEAFISFERSIALQNLADLRPPRWVSGLVSTHPPTVERIGAAVAFAERTGQSDDSGPSASPDPV